MKKLLFLFAAFAVVLSSCQKNEERFNEVYVSLTKDNAALAKQDVSISLRSTSNGIVYTASTDVAGKAVFTLKAGVYEASATLYDDTRIYNGSNSAIIVSDDKTNEFTLDMVEAVTSQVVIKELYNGGCTDDAGKKYQSDRYVILYNNSPEEADITDWAFGTLDPANAQATSKWLDNSGNLSYTDFMPRWSACWWFNTEVKIAPYSQIVIAINGAIDHTATVSSSVDLSHADYAMYDPEVFNNKTYYPAPSENIPSSHYLKTYLYGKGNAWALSVTSPAFVVFAPENTTTEAFVKNPDNIEDHGIQAFASAKVPLSWTKDALEVFNAAYLDSSQKRILPSADAGYVVFENAQGYTLYRNVNKEATEALAENAGKLVYNYAGGTEAFVNGSTDPSGIDAEASIANGAHIIYKDTNNSSVDFHQRKVASIKK